MEPQVGLVSGKLEEQEYGYAPGSRVYAGPDWGWQTQPSYEKTVKMRRGGAFFDFMSGVGDPIKQNIIAPVARFLAPAAQAVQGIIQSTPVVGEFTEAADITRETLRQQAVQRGYDASFGDVGMMAGEELFTAGLSKAAKVAGAISDAIPPSSAMPQLATAGVTPGVMGAVADVGEDLTTQIAQPLQIASDLKRGSAWQNTVRTLQQGDNTRQIRDFLLRGPGGKIKRENLLVTADELAANKEGVMDKLLERADAVAKAWDRYQRGGSAKAQRNLYDIASKNIFDSAEMIYGKDSARSYLAKVSNWLTNDEWHHVFGNKEAGEFILMQAAQDPLVAANIFKRMENLGLDSSGVAQNIALMKSNRHTNWHDFMKAEGFEPKSPGKPLTTAGSTAPGDFADLSKALGEEIAAGRGDVNDIFKMLDLYADYNRWVKSQLPKFGAEIISDLPEGHGKALQIGGYKTKPGRPRSKMK